MRASRLWPVAAASLLLTTPAFAQAQVAPQSVSAAASSLSVAGKPLRAGAPIKRENKLEGGGGWIIGAIGVIAGVTYAFVEGNDDDAPDVPVSP